VDVFKPGIYEVRRQRGGNLGDVLALEARLFKSQDEIEAALSTLGPGEYNIYRIEGNGDSAMLATATVADDGSVKVRST
jgi:hypothetical protein